jgi:hypothetical protein
MADTREVYQKGREHLNDLTQLLCCNNHLWTKHEKALTDLKKDLDEGMSRILLSELDEAAWKARCEKAE